MQDHDRLGMIDGIRWIIDVTFTRSQSVLESMEDEEDEEVGDDLAVVAVAAIDFEIDFHSVELVFKS